MNKENLTVHFKVKDFTAWRTSYNDTRRIGSLCQRHRLANRRGRLS